MPRHHLTPVLSVPLIACSVLMAPRTVHAQDADRWTGPDKTLHFVASAGLAAGGYGLASLWTDDRTVQLVAGSSLALGAGLGKELWDLSGRGNASWRDMAWNVIGTATGLALATLADWIWTRLNDRPVRSPFEVTRHRPVRPVEAAPGG